MNTNLNPEKAAAAIEAILFAAGCPVTYEKLAETMETSVSEMKWLVNSLVPSYEGRGIELLAYDDSCRLCTRAEHEETIKKALGLKRTGMLSNAALEVLAIISVNQPVTRAYVEQIRGVDSTYPVNTLVDRGLIEAQGRLDVPGRPVLYGTTEAFLRCFGLNSLSELDIMTTAQ